MRRTNFSRSASLRGKRMVVRKRSPNGPYLSEKTVQAAAQEILPKYKKVGGWNFLGKEFRASRSSIARGLKRKGFVTAVKSEVTLLLILDRLEADGKIKLPAKSKRGGKRVKKPN